MCKCIASGSTVALYLEILTEKRVGRFAHHANFGYLLRTQSALADPPHRPQPHVTLRKIYLAATFVIVPGFTFKSTERVERPNCLQLTAFDCKI